MRREIYLPNTSTLNKAIYVSLDFTFAESCKGKEEQTADTIAETLQKILNNNLVLNEEIVSLSDVEIERILLGKGQYGEGGQNGKVWLVSVECSNLEVSIADVSQKIASPRLPGSDDQGDVLLIFKKISSILKYHLSEKQALKSSPDKHVKTGVGE